jgi:protein-S-isoprenylcysteine O-methyltransferase Ste14
MKGRVRIASGKLVGKRSLKDKSPMPSILPPEKDRPGVPIAPPLLFVFPILVALALEWLFRTSFVQGELRWIAGPLLVAAGLALNIAGFVTQRRAGTDPIPFNPSTRIVAHGPYRFTRNPMYVGFALMTLGIAILVDSVWTLLAVPIGLVLTDRMVITREERYLERKFGEEYLSYKRRVRRWI